MDFIDSRLEYSDILFFFDSTINECIKNYNDREDRVNENKETRKNFDVTKSTNNMVEWIKNRYSKKIAKLRPLLQDYNDKLIVINNYEELNTLLERINEIFNER